MAAFTFTADHIDILDANNAYMTVNDEIAMVGTTVNNYGDVYLKPNDGYLLELENCYFWGYDDYSYESNFTFNGSNKSAVLTIYADYSYIELHVKTVIDPDATPPTPESDFTYTENLQTTVTENNCKLLCNGIELQVNDGFNNGDLLKLVPDSGYELISATITSFDDYNYDNVQTFVNGELTLDIPDGYYISYFDISTTQADIVIGSNNIFKITGEDLKQINKDRFVTDGGNPPSVIDYGTNILGVINLPFNIDSEYIQNPELIKLGTHETTVSAPKISTDKLVLNLGDIEVQAPSNLLDYSNARVLLHLPYAPIMTLDIDYVLGYIINVEYIINLYDGNAVINVKSNKTDKVIASGTVDLGVNIPYSSDAGNNPTANNTNVMIGGDNHVRSPFIEINRNVPLLADKFFTIPVIDESELLGNIGFIRVDEINLNVNATGREKDLIVSALKAGVIIK